MKILQANSLFFLRKRNNSTYKNTENAEYNAYKKGKMFRNQ